MVKKAIEAVGYVRMSTDRQEDSPARQRQDIEALADRMGYEIVSWYEDRGLTGTESINRPEFQRLLVNAKQRKFKAVLLSEQSRMSREDIFDAMVHWRSFRDAGVAIVTCQRGELDFHNLGGMITAIVDQYGAREESVKLAERVTSGQRSKAKQGHRIGGMVFGYDRQLYDDRGKFMQQVHFRDRFRKPSSWTSRIVPSSDRKAVDGIKWAFEAIRKGHSINAVKIGLNKRGLRSVYNKPFSHASTMGLLTNPAYIGVLRVGKYSVGKFSRISDGGLIVVKDTHESIVSRELFEEVQEIIRIRKTGKPHAKPERYLLSGLIKCQHCRCNVHGVRIKCQNRRGKEIENYYQCSVYQIQDRPMPECMRPVVRADRLESFVMDAVRKYLLDGKVEKRIRDAIVQAKRQGSLKSSSDQRKMAELQKNIERGTVNLALAKHEDFLAISNLLSQWREELNALSMRMETQHRMIEPLPEALSVLAKYANVAENVLKSERNLLTTALRQTIKSIVIRIKEKKSGEIKYRELSDALEFHDGFQIRPIEIPDSVLANRRVWREIGEMADRAGRPLRLADVGKLIESKDPCLASYHMSRAVMAGVIKKSQNPPGWISTRKTKVSR